MKSLVVSAVIMIALVMMPAMAVAQSDQTPTTPPLSQPLVREGTLATKLADVLQVGTPATETEAESALSAVGVAPKNGWIADYPVTPDIAVELQTSVGDAAAAGRIPLTKDAAAKAFQDVMTSYNLSVEPGISNPTANAAYPPDYPDSGIMNDYYYDEGPPVVTYYAPPPDYAYLYSWVPYPFWWWDFWFPGFFVLADFDFHGHHHHDGHHDGDHDGHHHGDGDRESVSNHFRDPSSGRMTRIDPANRAHGGTFADRGGNTGWTSPTARSGAQSILTNSGTYSRRANSLAASPSATGTYRPSSGGTASVSTAGRRTATGSWTPTARTSGGTNFNSRRSYTQGTYNRAPHTFVPSSGQSRTFSQPAYRSQGSFTPSMGGRSFTAPSGGWRSFSAPSAGRWSGNGSFGGMRGFSGGGRSFGGGRR